LARSRTTRNPRRGTHAAPAAPAATHELVHFVQSVTDDLAREYERIRRRACEDPGTTGDEAELDWAELFREWLPPDYCVTTKGRILGEFGTPGPQVDVVILRPSYPPRLRKERIYLAGGVAAAFECKLTLKPSHVSEAIAKSVQMKRQFPRRLDNPYFETTSPVLYGLLAHQSVWKANRETQVARLLRLLDEDKGEGKIAVRHPSELLDVVCVANLDCLALGREVFSYSTMRTHYFNCAARPGREDAPEFNPIATLLCYLLRRLAWEDTRLRGISVYFDKALLAWRTVNRSRDWSPDFYSTATRQRLESRPAATTGLYNPWDEWSHHPIM